ncbi:hypothetical protein ACIHCV_22225 [Streptomyces sp. NPDC051956]
MHSAPIAKAAVGAECASVGAAAMTIMLSSRLAGRQVRPSVMWSPRS